MGFGNNKKDQLKSQVENLWALNRDLNERLKDKDWRLGALEEHGTHLQDKVNNLQLLCRELTDQSRNETENSTNGVAVLNEKLRVVGQDRETLKTEIDITNAINDTLRQQLSDHIKTEQNLCEEGNELQKTVKSLRERLWISIKAIRTLKEEKAGLQVRLRYLEELVECTNGRTGGDIESFYNEKDTLRKSNANLHEQLKAHTQLIAELRSGKSALEVQHTALQRQYSILQSEASTLRKTKPRTMRSLLAIRVVEAAYVAPSLERGDDPGGPADGHWSPLGISVGKLDSPVDLEELADQLPTGTSADSFYRLLTLQICSVCTKPKLKALKNDRSGNNKLLESLDEFPAKRSYFPCCYGVVCAECMIKRTCENVESGWWHRLGSLQWVACPRKGCEEMLVIRCEGDLQGFLEMNGDTEIGAHVKMYEKALALRRALESLEPHPTPETLLAASKLHAHLQKQNYIHSFFSPRFEATEIDESGCIPDFEPGTITQADIGSRTAAKIPVFGRFFRRQAIPKTCIVCSQAKFEVAYGGVEEWEKACVEFKGKWMWDMLVFPTKRVQECEHEFEACRSCTADYIASALESTGCDRLPCPQCDRALTDSEVRRLGNSSTVERYDALLLQKHLSQDPNFRWCLGEGCGDGQIYIPSLFARPIVSCKSCKTKMCFKHQVLWHKGMSCVEFDSQREHGDPGHTQTVEWIKNHSKQCPGKDCGISIVKGKGCFHMTCKSCKYEFCWECLASWTEIRNWGPPAHKSDCWFRTSGVNPVSVTGNNLDAARTAHAARTPS